ncbi:MAG: putative lipid II flippase FtsW [Acidimicrobiia bacterium]|nr:putative lipid II flippase FtsW [Acidimicrobiia bacterium]
MATSVTPIARARSIRRAREAARAADRNSVLVLLPVATLLVVGLGAILSASSVIARIERGDQFFYFKRQIMWAVLGVGVLIIAIRIPYHLYKKYSGVIFGLSVVGLAATWAIGSSRGGSQRWIEVGPITLQASEFSKFAVVVFLAAALSRKQHYLDNLGHFLLPVAGSLGVTALLLMIQPDLGTTILISATAIAMLLASTTPLRFVFGLTAFGTAGALASALTQPYQLARIRGFLDPAADPLGYGLQPLQSLVALGTGGWFGVGLGASRARWSFLPNAHTDFIFSIIGEETGLAGSLTIVALFAVLAVVGISVARRAPDMFGRLLAIGLVSWLSFQALINIGGVAVVLPITGVPLPFVSSGGSAMLANMAAAGVLVNIARATARGGKATS